MAKNKGGRPVVFTDQVVQKLEEVFAIDGTVEEACYYANISRQNYYDHVKVGTALFDRFQSLRERPVLKARQTAVKALDDPQHAHWYLERKRKKEFSVRSEITGADGKAIEVKTITGMEIVHEDPIHNKKSKTD